MSIECGECERDLRGCHEVNCSRHEHDFVEYDSGIQPCNCGLTASKYIDFLLDTVTSLEQKNINNILCNEELIKELHYTISALQLDNAEMHDELDWLEGK